ncbi:MAG: S8 family serine peptidase [Pikeienuella sp.]
MTDGSDKFSGEGLFYLWHLEAIGLISVPSDGTPFNDAEHAPLWQAAKAATGQPTRVAIIDNGAPSRHPGFGDRLSDPMDFSGHANGAVYSDQQVNPFAGLYTGLSGGDQDTLAAKLAASEALSAPLQHALPKLTPSSCSDVKAHNYIGLDDPAERFAAHGAACAGLVGATPVTSGGDLDAAISYSGVDPTCHIIPITSTYDQTYWPLVMSLLYALASKADVVLMPRAIEPASDPVPEDEYQDTRLNPRWSRIDCDPARSEDFKLLKWLAEFVAERIPMIVPAGNSGLPELEFPASMVTDGDAPIIVAGAATALGRRASYSNHLPGFDGETTGVTVYAPSDDRAEISDTQFRIDPFGWSGRNIPYAKYARGNLFSPYSVLTTDLPGRFGYSAEEGDDYDWHEQGVPPGYADLPEFRNQSLYTLFGGTSAASAITAGVASLVQTLARAYLGAPLTGIQMRDLMRNLQAPAEVRHGYLDPRGDIAWDSPIAHHLHLPGSESDLRARLDVL